MKCKDCKDTACSYRTTDAETECVWNPQARAYIKHDNGKVEILLSPKALWISETAVKLIAQIPYEYVTDSIGKAEPRHLYAARVAKEMADVIFGEN